MPAKFIDAIGRRFRRRDEHYPSDGTLKRAAEGIEAAVNARVNEFVSKRPGLAVILAKVFKETDPSLKKELLSENTPVLEEIQHAVKDSLLLHSNHAANRLVTEYALDKAGMDDLIDSGLHK
ncbi:hypothetical protein HY095_02450 [Candidatus Micrarchaeota archaeon]|nr:hypothetical protein [Candidatus Micrarchaeota archaeon]